MLVEVYEGLYFLLARCLDKKDKDIEPKKDTTKPHILELYKVL